MSVAENLERVRDSIIAAERSAGRREGAVTLIAVSKFHPASSVLEAIDAGQLVFGENRVQEAAGKFPEILAAHPDVALHVIGSLQRNKVRQAIELSQCIQSVDRPEVLTEIGKRAAEQERHIDILFEYHTGEESKAGFRTPESLYSSIDLLRDLPFVRCRGFMTMAPFTADDKEVRSSFRSLGVIANECMRRYPSLDFSVLSMGMSSDFRVAIEEGSTMVRIGTAIFGTRT